MAHSNLADILGISSDRLAWVVGNIAFRYEDVDLGVQVTAVEEIHGASVAGDLPPSEMADS